MRPHTRSSVPQVYYTVDAGVPTDWHGFTGHISADMMRRSLFVPGGAGGNDGGGKDGGREQGSEPGGGEGGSGEQGGGKESGGGAVAVLLCGPPPMIKFACRPALQELGFGEDQVIEF